VQTINGAGGSTQFAHSRPSYRKPLLRRGYLTTHALVGIARDEDDPNMPACRDQVALQSKGAHPGHLHVDHEARVVPCALASCHAALMRPMVGLDLLRRQQLRWIQGSNETPPLVRCR
jgi:hypothetical protein